MLKKLTFDNPRRNEEPHPYKGRILFYLRRGKPLAAAPMSYQDRETGQKIIEAYCLTDDVYFWTSDIIYHFEKYNYSLSEAFVAHVLKQI